MSGKVKAFVVIAEFNVSAEYKQEFLELCEFDSVRSTEDEPGCHQFDVSTSDESPNLVVLYEIYEDKAAFEAHQAMPHYAVFREGVERMGIHTVQVRTLQRHYA